MTDPADSGYTCCGQPMEPIIIPAIRQTGVLAWLCPLDGKWRYNVPRAETQLRALIQAHMERLVGAARNDPPS